jgi:hypothetical protein
VMSLAIKYVSQCDIYAFVEDANVGGGIVSLFDVDEELAMSAVCKNGLCLELLSPSSRRNKRIISAAVHQNGWALQYALGLTENDSSIVLAALHQNGLALQFAPRKLREASDIVYVALTQNPLALEYAPSELQNCREVAIHAVRIDGQALRFVGDSLTSDRDLVMRALASPHNGYHSMRQVIAARMSENEWSLISSEKCELFRHICSMYHRYTLSIDEFKHGFLSCGIQFSACHHPTQVSKLRALGKYKHVEVKRLIAEYAGVQVGDRWNYVRKSYIKVMMK